MANFWENYENPKNNSNKVATIRILIIVIVLLSVIIVPTIISYNKKKNLENFPQYTSIEIDEEDLEDVESFAYENIRNKLQNDYYFSKFATIRNYDSSKFNPLLIEEMLKSFIYNYELTNKNHFSSSIKSEEIYCLSKSATLKAFKELYDINVSKYLDSYMLGYAQYIYKDGNNYCFYFGNVSKMEDMDHLIAVERLSMSGSKITADLYVYSFYSNNTPERLNVISKAKSYIKNKDYDVANKIVDQELNGKIEHNGIQFKVNGTGDYFKYKLIKSYSLDY